MLWQKLHPITSGKRDLFGRSRERDDAMTLIMNPSASEGKTTTTGQIYKAVANYRALLESHASGFDAAVVQLALGSSELAGKQLAAFREHVEGVKKMLNKMC